MPRQEWKGALKWGTRPCCTIATAITDSTDIDCTSESQARHIVDALLKHLKPRGGMMAHGIQQLPPKMAQQFADRAKRGEGRHIGAQCYQFHQGSNVIALVSLDPPQGHIKRDPRLAQELRDAEDV